MNRFLLLLRCMLILALCLEGAVGALSSTAMAANATSRALASAEVSPPAHHEEGTAAKDDQACAADVAVDGNRSEHEGEVECDCLAADCTCPCTIPTFAIAHVVPFAARHVVALKPAAPGRSQTVALPSSRVFRPPIG